MIKKTITYKDLDGNSITEDFYFALSKAEIAEMELRQGGGMEQYLTAIVASGNGGMIMSAFKEFVVKSYGRRSENMRSFLKSDEITMEFLGTDAYSQLFMELVTDAKAGAEFVAGIMPVPIPEGATPVSGSLELPEAKPKEWNEYTRDELLNMPAHEFDALVKAISGNNIPKTLLMVSMARMTKKAE